MKTSTRAIPLLAAAALSLAACSKSGDTQNLSAGNDVVLNDEDALVLDNAGADDALGNAADIGPATGNDTATDRADPLANAQ